jgi:hypothetical protein
LKARPYADKKKKNVTPVYPKAIIMAFGKAKKLLETVSKKNWILEMEKSNSLQTLFGL